MSETTFYQKLEAGWAQKRFVCVGLDSDIRKIPIQRAAPSITLFDFNSDIVDATHRVALAYKLNSAFYEMCGPEGIRALIDTINHIRRVAPGSVIILDGKRGDIGNTSEAYANAAFHAKGGWDLPVRDMDRMDVDAVTVNPYLGMDALEPFLGYTSKGIIVLCRTSNPGAKEFQNLQIVHPDFQLSSSTLTLPIYQYVAERVARCWNANGNCALVVGATCPEELRLVRNIVGDMPILIPGVGAQQGDLKKTIHAGVNSKGEGFIINSSRGIIFASKGKDFADKAREEAEKLNQAILECVAAIRAG